MSASGQNTIYYKFTFAGKVNRQRQKADQRLRWAGSTNRETGKGYSGTLSSDGDALKLNFCDVCTTPFTKKQYFNDRVNCTSVELVLKKNQSNSPKPANPVEPQYTHARGGWQAPPLLVSLRGTGPRVPHVAAAPQAGLRVRDLLSFSAVVASAVLRLRASGRCCLFHLCVPDSANHTQVRISRLLGVAGGKD